MKPVLFGVALVTVALSVASCRNPFASDAAVILDVSKLEAPASVSAGVPISVVVTVVTGGCRSFDYIDVDRNASGASITVWGRDAALGKKNVACPADIRYEPHSVTFDPPFATTFHVSVHRGAFNPLTATVQVQ